MSGAMSAAVAGEPRAGAPGSCSAAGAATVRALRRTRVAACARDLRLPRCGDQEILRLVAWDGLAPAQAGMVLGCSPGAARVRLHRARRRLAQELAKRSPGGGQRGNEEPIEPGVSQCRRLTMCSSAATLRVTAVTPQSGVPKEAWMNGERSDTLST